MGTADDFCRKAVNFDLNTESLKKIFKSNNPFVYMIAYRKIGRFLINNGFEHRQWSGYISKQSLTPIQVTAIVKGLNKTLPWLHQCVTRFDVTDIGEQHDLMYIFQKSEKSKLQFKSVETKENETKGKTPLSRKQIKNNAKIITQKNTVSKEKQTDKLR